MCDEVSFLNLEEWLKRIEENVDSSVELIVIGNKIDLVNDRTVSEEQMALFAEKNGITYFETSAKDYSHVEKAFKQLLSRVLSNEAL